jgi:hypothetical protein
MEDNYDPKKDPYYGKDISHILKANVSEEGKKIMGENLEIAKEYYKEIGDKEMYERLKDY